MFNRKPEACAFRVGGTQERSARLRLAVKRDDDKESFR